MKKINTVIFDLDSTLVTIEGLDWLAQRKSLGEKVAELTKKSMEGSVDFKNSLVIKMKLLSPSIKDILLMGEAYCENIVLGVKKTVRALKDKGVDVWIVTGNFLPAVNMLADRLQINKNNIICNDIFFNSDGSYHGYDINNPLASNGGKAIVIKNMPNYKNRKIFFVGDGITDLEAKDSVSKFIGFGGVSSREKVKQEADVFIDQPNMKGLINILDFD